MVHSFPQFELDEDRFELRRGGRAVKAEPRVLEVLVHLVRNAGRVVAKEELLDQVWKKSFVSDSALTRCIMEARRAIGDHERETPFIKTVHGRGYRFEAPEEPLVPAAAPAAIQQSAATDDAVAIADLAAIEVLQPAQRRQFRAVVRSIALTVLGIAIAMAWLWTRHGAEAVPRQLVTAHVALLPIAMNEENRELQMVGMSIADLLEQRLNKIVGIRVRGADYSRPISVSARSLADVAKRAGVEYVISGSLTASGRGDRAQLVLVLHQVRNNGTVRDTPLGAYSLPLLRRSEDITQYAAFRDLAVSRVVATVLPAFDVKQQGSSTPRSFDSYRMYLLARERLASRGCDGEAAIELLRQSLEVDEQFAPAWNAYAWAHYRLASACTGGRSHYRQALDAAERTLALAPDLGSAITLKARVMADTGRVEEAYQLIRAATQKDPANVDLGEANFAILAQAGFLDPARMHLQRVVRTDPNHLGEHGMVATPLLYSGDLQHFVESLPESDAPRFRFARGFAELMQGRPQIAYRTLEPSFRSNPADAYARLSHALLAVIEGRHDEARAITRHFARQRDAVGETDAEMTYRIAQLAALAGDDSLALAQLERAVAGGFFCAVLIEKDPALVSIRGTARYDAALQRARKRHEGFAVRFGLERGAISSNVSRASEAPLVPQV